MKELKTLSPRRKIKELSTIPDIEARAELDFWTEEIRARQRKLSPEVFSRKKVKIS